MADRREFGKGQVVRSVELQAALDALESADQNLADDLGFYGVVSGLVASETGPQSSFVDVTPGLAYDDIGRRVLNTGGAIDLFTDLNNASTEVTTSGNERWVSLLVRYVRNESDQRVIAPPLGDGIAYFHEQLEASQLIVRAGAEATAGAATKPTAGANELILADSLLTFGQTLVTDADLDTARRVDFAGLGGGGKHTIQDEGSPLTERTSLNFVGDGVTLVDNVGSDSTDVNITATTHARQVEALASYATVDGVTAIAVAGGAAFLPSDWGLGLVYEFEVVLSVNDGARLATAILWNVTDNEAVTGASLSTSSLTPVKLSSGPLTVGSAAGNLQDTEKIYEIRILNDGTALAELTFLHGAKMVITGF